MIGPDVKQIWIVGNHDMYYSKNYYFTSARHLGLHSLQ